MIGLSQLIQILSKGYFSVLKLKASLFTGYFFFFFGYLFFFAKGYSRETNEKDKWKGVPNQRSKNVYF